MQKRNNILRPIFWRPMAFQSVNSTAWSAQQIPFVAWRNAWIGCQKQVLYFSYVAMIRFTSENDMCL